ncbi:hypothetical protein [Flavobacterium aquiphilum]|uniref:hypothetical protein n=1 Tax=Flavobacterium aquiphilum TaxID=3003261 RepID=UPI002481056D|nr:hypothetical protein [Flavobacterium aquiphilum]
MKTVKSIITVIGIVVKYGAVVMAVIKGIEVVHSELEKIDFGEGKKEVEPIAEKNE